MERPQNGIGRYDVILFYDMEVGEITPEWRSLLDHGGGFVFLHHAIGSFPNSSEFATIVGGHANFAREPVSGAPLQSTYHMNQRQHFTIKDRDHPVTCNLPTLI